MASGNTVSITFAGDATKLQRAFSDVGSSAKKMAGDLDSAEGQAKGFGSTIDNVGGAVGNAEGKFMGAADLLDGLGGAFGLPTDAATGMFRAFGDLSGGFEVVSGLFPGLISKLGAMVGITGAQTAATGAATTSQWSLNAALHANPIGAVVLAIGLLVGAFVLAWKHSETFRDIVKGALGIVKDAAVGLWDFFKTLPDKLWSISNAVKDAILWPFKTAFNAVARLWNNTVGQLSFEVPSWVPGGFGGKGFSMPKLPEYHQGGTVPGPAGAPTPAMLLGGETVLPVGAGTAGGPLVIQLVVDGRVLAEIVRDRLLQKQRTTPLGFVT